MCDLRRQCSGSNPRAGLTIVELLVSIAIMSTLTGILLPAVGAAREAARSVECANRLRQLGIALHGYHEQHQVLPAGWRWEPEGQSAYGWATALLPFLDQSPLYEQTRWDRLLADPLNQLARGSSLPAFLCPSDVIEPRFVLYEEAPASPGGTPLVELPTANYMGVFGTLEADDTIPAPPGDGAFIESRPIRFAELLRGLSNTLIVGERTMARVPSTWLGIDARGEDAACRLVGNAEQGPNCTRCDECEFGSRHPGGSKFLFGDGRVAQLSENMNREQYQQMSRRTCD